MISNFFALGGVLSHTKRSTSDTTDGGGNANSPHYLEVLRGRDGRDGEDWVPGPAGQDGKDGRDGRDGERGDPGSVATSWQHTSSIAERPSSVWTRIQSSYQAVLGLKTVRCSTTLRLNAPAFPALPTTQAKKWPVPCAPSDARVCHHATMQDWDIAKNTCYCCMLECDPTIVFASVLKQLYRTYYRSFRVRINPWTSCSTELVSS